MSLAKPSEFGVALKDVALEVREGEIFGVAGVAGNGQNELLSAMSGETLAPHAAAIRSPARTSGGSASPSGATSAFAPCRRNAMAMRRSASSR